MLTKKDAQKSGLAAPRAAGSESSPAQYAPNGHRPIPNDSGHFVQFYEDDSVLLQSVCAFIGAGLGAGEGSLIVATEAHREALAEMLSDNGINVAQVISRGQLLMLDARETLAKLLISGLPDEDRFMKSIGGMVAKTAQGRPALRAFGEMVALLWAENNVEGALKLEQLWNKLGNTFSFSLFCAYPINGFRDSSHGKLFAGICSEHGAVIPAESYREHAPADERMRSVAVLQQKASALEAEVAERKRIEEALRLATAELGRQVQDLRVLNQASMRLTAIVESSHDAIIGTDLDGRVTSWNKSAERMFGYAAGEAIGRGIGDILIPPGRDDEEPGILDRIRAGERVEHYETELKRKDGGLVDISLTVSPIMDEHGTIIGASKISRDITERKRFEGALSESERRFRTMSDSAPVLMWMTDAQGACTYVNKPWLDFTGNDSATEAARDPLEGVHPEDRAKGRDILQLALETRSGFRLEYRYRRHDGEYRWLLDTGTPRFSEDGTFLGFIGSCIDINDLKETEEQLRQAQKMEAVGRLAGGIAHDFNNLLTAINGYSEMALGLIEGDDNLAEYLGEIKRSGERAASLTQQLLAYSRKQILAPTILDLNETVADMDRMLRRLIGEHIHLESSLDPALGMVRADPGQIQQIILNLVLNARDAMPHGGRLVFETSNVVLDKGQGASAARPHVMLAIRDTGSGMSSEVKARIFEPFFTTKEVGKGTGLGLSSAYGIIKQSGGLIAVDSEPDKGSVFKIYLPIVERSGDPESAGPGDATAAKGLRDETILLVEDEETVRKFIMRTLSAQGYTVLEAKDGSAALTLGEKCRNVDLLLTDVVMPNMNGATLSERLKALHPDIRILFMSGYTDNIFLPGGLIDPAAKFLQKPFGQADLQSKVRELLDQKGA
ncbi:MAG TPA: PAS domain S-box protein [Fibrobacteria bacterium]|nr:PAS domain S-box protein [Fibrobacteria bacterium]